MLYSVAGGQIDRWAQPQMLRFFLGMTGLFVVAMVPIWFWRNMSFPAYCLAILLLIAVEFVGTTGMGAQRWIDLGFIRLQPSEVMKIALVLVLAAYYDWLPREHISRPFWVLLPALLIVWTYRDPRELILALKLTSFGALAWGVMVGWGLSRFLLLI